MFLYSVVYFSRKLLSLKRSLKVIFNYLHMENNKKLLHITNNTNSIISLKFAIFSSNLEFIKIFRTGT